MVAMGNPSPRCVRGGAFPEMMQERVATALSLACREAEKAEVRLGLENVRSCWGNSGYNTALILERVNSPWLSAIWDPANGFVSGEEDAYPDGYEAVRPYISHVHLKDAVVENVSDGLIRWERIGDGDVRLQEQMTALRADGYAGCVSIETHWSPPGGSKESNTRQTYDGLIEMLGRICDPSGES
jgi:sugar phosphate isomerase/epimerase